MLYKSIGTVWSSQLTAAIYWQAVGNYAIGSDLTGQICEEYWTGIAEFFVISYVRRKATAQAVNTFDLAWPLGCLVCGHEQHDFGGVLSMLPPMIFMSLCFLELSD